jgi:3-oxoadipate enol-lactonase
MSFLDRSGGVRLFYEIWGEESGNWVTLVNGYSRSSTDFRALARFLSEQGYRVLTFDNRGAGKTECPLNFSLSDMVSDVGALWDEVGAEQSHILGISYGGVVSLRVARSYPERVSSLGLISTSPTSRFIHAGSQLYEQSPAEVEAEMSKYFSTGFAARNELLFRALLKETAKAFRDAPSRERARAQRQALGAFDFTADLSSIQAPVLIVHGDADRVIDVAAVAVFSEGMPQAKTEIFQGAGHLLLAEAPKRLYEVIADFYTSLSKPAPVRPVR